LIGADLYYQTSGERFRIGFGAKIYSIILFSAVIPSIYAEFNTRRFAAAIQAGAIPIMFSMVVPIGASMEFSMLSVSGWFKITERFRVGAIGYYDFKMPALIPLFVVSARWTLAGADDAGS
ncbi:MAG: hypothetical protein LBB48_09300, partial [Treponema sp.]|nr:hypothetical protein [Treponema sp.]